MKKNKWLIIGVVGVLAYMYFKKKKKAEANAKANAENVDAVEEVVDVMEDNINNDLLS